MLTEALQIISNPQRSRHDVNRLAAVLNHLVEHDFESLVQLLYRVDVPEKAVRQLLQQEPTRDAGLLLATLLLDRQAAKDATRNQFRQSGDDIPEEDRW